ncbi:type I-D CRISPR-associated protein Cas7/Csc2 [Sulfolobus islandicus]|uniref:CRISPR-associated, crenarchaeal family 3 protein n=1 Tax=Saccharolobus islandicus (strain HVE10/4) TaxID=930943 RepID=F0NNS7_SACI0|nr:type I-D CRISPR-associated protein Cas7/Csc2 [Sulfolobus islandicus]ADX82113.1 CRISPR-associated, crenarchaeal family 3 protein [Sulfolobus islandicus HVE10/4]WCM36549.1 type I-D CRISPR-associated protein Cas7/Csc2 [Sulfolobus islandicus]
MNGIEAVSKILGNEKISTFFADLSKPNKENAVPRGRVANVFVTILAEGELVIRHEGGEDVTLASIDGEKYPMILHEKLVSSWRREMLEQLRHGYDLHKEEINKIREKSDEWHCSLRPTTATGRKDERMGGLCRECPNCMTFGYAVGEEERYNLKSRIEGDVYLATLPEKKSVVVRTFNAIDEPTHTTFIQAEGARTGALFRLSLIKVGTPFVGKIAMKDLAPAEFALALYSLINTTRVGGIRSDFGKIRIIIAAIALCDHEVSSGYEIFEKTKELDNVSEIVWKINEQVKSYQGECQVFTSEDFSPKISEIVGNNKHDIIKEAWINGLNFKKSIEEFIKK